MNSEIPGFIDLQVNGFKGVDFSSPELTLPAVEMACAELISSGTIAFLPTIISSSEEVYKRNLKIISDVIEQSKFKNHLLGIHLEGPFISAQDGARGAHNEKWIKEADLSFLKKLIDWSAGNIKLLTIAAEEENADTLCKFAVDNGIHISLGHQLADENDLEKLVESGASMLTHLGNALPLFVPRHKNPIWAGLANDDLKAMIIADGFHLPSSIIKTVIKTKGLQNVIVVSDGSPITGNPPGNYFTLGNDVILEKSGFLYNPKSGFMVGSSATMLNCANYLLSLDFLELQDIYDLTFYNPLRFLGINPELIKQEAKIKFIEKERAFLAI